MQTVIFVCFITLACVNNAAHAQTDTAGGGVLFILDGSGSMWGRVQGKEKIAIAREVMGELITDLPNEVQVGLMSYGHRSRGQCEDIELLVPVGASSKTDVVVKINGIMPKGKTPITGSFQLAGEQLRNREDETTVVLISDGEETCGGDPCTLVRDLRQQGINVRVHVVGFDVGQAERDQLVCIADAGGGKYFSADNADQLKGALTEVRQQVVAAAKIPEPEPAAKRVISIKSPPKPGNISVKNIRADYGMSIFRIVDSKNRNGVADCIATHNRCDGELASVKVKPGSYNLNLQNFGGLEYKIGHFDVSAGQDIVVDINTLIGFITLSDASEVNILDSKTMKFVAVCGSIHKCHPVPVRPGTYKLEIGNNGYESAVIEVKAGEEIVIDLGGG